jgi:hypothetical protein
MEADPTSEDELTATLSPLAGVIATRRGRCRRRAADASCPGWNDWQARSLYVPVARDDETAWLDPAWLDPAWLDPAWLDPAGLELAITRGRARLRARPFRSDFELVTTGGESTVVRRFRPA